jgi:hypothetical protein
VNKALPPIPPMSVSVANKGLTAIWLISVANKGLSGKNGIALHPGAAQCSLAAVRELAVREEVT